MHISWLIPGEKTPCDILFYFRGKYVVALKAGGEITLEFVAKLFKTEYPLAYIEKTKQAAWQSWTQTRHPHLITAVATTSTSGAAQSKPYGNKRSEFLSYLQRGVVARNANESTQQALLDQAAEAVKYALKSPSWDWYFQQFHEPPTLFYHCARVTYLCALLWLRSGLEKNANLEYLLQSAMIHELVGDPGVATNIIVSECTIKMIEEDKRPIQKEIIDLIRMHDELISGKGFPNKLGEAQLPLSSRIFSLCNHFDHNRLRAPGNSRRARFEHSKKTMEAHREDYDSSLWQVFWKMLTEEYEMVA